MMSPYLHFVANKFHLKN